MHARELIALAMLTREMRTRIRFTHEDPVIVRLSRQQGLARSTAPRRFCSYRIF